MKEIILPNLSSGTGALTESTVPSRPDYRNNFAINSVEASFSPAQIAQIATLYADVFRGPPWNEAVKCDLEGKFCGPEIALGSSCQCGGTFIEAYPLEETIGYIEVEIQKPGFSGATIKNGPESTVGFAWSYLATPATLVQEKWSDSQNQQAILALLEQSGLPSDLPFRYFCEIGIDPRFRRLGLANLLTQQVIGPETTLYRTNTATPMMAVGAALGFSQIMGPKVIIDRQLQTIIPTGEVVNRLDSERPDRVLFIKPSLL